ncbi:MAG: 5-formyltetrahydrofolate cyclo-ligase [Candidatus Thiodiazotropha sp. (ex Notomyrtea botanica)]|nr:5-formyltetrahydrofolate cyclo-ligase [Candidatus Thiodiazotropha sp. (ex Notomyrtea botanica)]
MQLSQLRQEMRAKRQQLTPHQLRQHSQQLLRLTSNYKPFRHSRRIAFYFASRGEMDPAPLMKLAMQAGMLTYLPVLRKGPARGLWFTPYHNGDRLLSNRFGIPEPKRHHGRQVMPWALDAVFFPLVAFDGTGNRLGMGGGYYDRTFAYQKQRKHWKGPKLIGIAHDFQYVDSLPNQPWDIPLDAVITEAQIYTFQKTDC